MPRAIWQLKATFATSQSCRKRAIVSPDVCSPMTNNAGCQFDMWERRTSCFAAPLFPHSTGSCLVPASVPSCVCHMSPLRARGMCTLTRAPRNQSCVRHSAEPAPAPPTSSFTALLIDPLAVRAQALLPSLFFGQRMPSVLSKNLPTRS